MHAVATRQMALDLLSIGLTRRDVCLILDVGYNSTYRWEQRLEPLANGSAIDCFRCAGEPAPDPTAYLSEHHARGRAGNSPRARCLGFSSR